MALDDAARPDPDGPLDDGVGPDFHVVGDLGLGADDGRRVDRIGRGERHPAPPFAQRTGSVLHLPIDPDRAAPSPFCNESANNARSPQTCTPVGVQSWILAAYRVLREMGDQVRVTDSPVRTLSISAWQI